MTFHEEIIEYIIKGQQNYKGWYCSYVGVGTVKFIKNGYKDVKAYRGYGVENWIEDCWKECKDKIDKLN